MFFEKTNEILIAAMGSREEMQVGLINGSVGVFTFKNTIDFSR